MKKIFASAILTAALIFNSGAFCAAASDISLPAPSITRTKQLGEVMRERQTSRDLSGAPLSKQELSNILWAANGITTRFNGTKGHVNPAAMSIYAVDVYAVTAEGIYLYLPDKHELKLITKGDFRTATTSAQRPQECVKNAPLSLVYVENSDAWKSSSRPVNAERQAAFANIAVGTMCQSVALMANNLGYGNSLRGSVDTDAFTKAAKLSSAQKILFAQSIGDSQAVAKG